jgi:hypothetical protein
MSHTVPSVCRIEQKQRRSSFIVKYVRYQIIEGEYFDLKSVFFFNSKSKCYGSGSGCKGSTQKGMVSMAPRGGKPEEYQYFDFKKIRIFKNCGSGSALVWLS